MINQIKKNTLETKASFPSNLQSDFQLSNIDCSNSVSNLLNSLSNLYSPHFLQTLQKYDHIIWDWNGTLLNDLHCTHKTLTSLLDYYKLPQQSLSQYREKFGFPLINYYQYLGFKTDPLHFQKLANEFMFHYENNLHMADLFRGTRELLSELKKQNIQQSILSAAEQKHLEQVLDQFQLRSYFKFIFGIDNNWAANKIHRGHQLMKESQVASSQTLLIGDTLHDLEVGHALGIQVLLLADGHQDFHRLSSHHDQVLNSRYQ